MKKFLKIFGIVVLLLLAAAVTIWYLYLKPPPPPISDLDRARLQMMPLPSKLNYDEGSLVVSENMGTSINKQPSDKLSKALDRFYEKLGAITSLDLKDGSEKLIHIEFTDNSGTYPQLSEDEAYDLTIDGSGIYLKAPTDKGVLYGLETLLQLVESNSGQWSFPAITITDHPRYPWRGLMIDAARHWMPKDVILRNLDAMATLKLNVFHWHLSDYQGFRVESKKYPKLHQLGAAGHYYTQNDIREVVNYAAERGIRVVPEFDVPGHTTSWLVGYPELASAPGPYKIDTLALGVFSPVMDPTNPAVYEFLDEFVTEMVTLFPDDYFHIGGDEVMAKDWDENENIQKFMEQNDIGDSHELQAYFNLKLQKIIADHGKIMLGWDEIIHPDLPVNGIAVQAWRNHKSLWEAARKGNKTILSNGYYLDHKKSAEEYYKVDPEVIKGAVNIDIDSVNWTSWKTEVQFGENIFEGDLYTFGKDDDIQIIMDFMGNATSISEVQKQGNHINFTNKIDVGNMEVSLDVQGDSINGKTKVSFFELDMKGVRSGGSDMPDGLPLPKFDKIEPLKPEEKKNILGGEACMWSEMVDSITLESRIWPKAAVIAEKLWSPGVLTNNTEDMYRRLMVVNEFLVLKGLQHQNNQEYILKNMVAPEYFEALDYLVDYLQEGAFANRMSLYDPTLYTTTALDQIVDAASAESYPAYEFNRKVELWLDNKDDQVKDELVSMLQKWIENDIKLKELFESNQNAAVIQKHSENLRLLALMALKSFNREESNTNKEDLNKLLADARLEYGGTVLAVLPGLEKLILAEDQG